MHNEGFGKKWIDRILGKVDKDQGIANAGKVLGIGNDGQVVPVEQSGGGSSITVDSALNAESTNPVENGVITSALANKLDTTQTTKNKLLMTNNSGKITFTSISEIGSTTSISYFSSTLTHNNKTYRSGYFHIGVSEIITLPRYVEDKDTGEIFRLNPTESFSSEGFTDIPEGTIIVAPISLGTAVHYIYVEDAFATLHPNLRISSTCLHLS